MSAGKATYKMHVKHLCRDELRRFIADRFDSTRLLDAKVLCLPGREALEIAEVYDPLRIKRQNTTCLEQNNAVSNELRRRYLGIRLKKLSLAEFSSRHPFTKFDIVSLDFTGQLGTFESDIYQLSKAGHLAEDAIIFTNFLGARETAASKGYYYHWGLPLDVRRITLEELHRYANRRSASPKQCAARLARRLDPYFPKSSSAHTSSPMNLSELRSTAIHRAVEHAITNGKRPSMFELYFRERDRKGVLTREVLRFRNASMKGYEVGSDKATKDISRSIEQFNKRRQDCFPPLLLYDLDKRLVKHLAALFRYAFRKTSNFILDEKFLAEIWLLAIDTLMSSQAVVLDSKSYKYIGDGGSPMYADIFHVRRIDDFDFVKQHLRLDGKTVRSLLSPLLALSPTVFARLSREVAQRCRTVQPFFGSPSSVERVFLGREKRRKREALTKTVVTTNRQTALDLLGASPVTIEDVALATGAKPMQVAAWKAHITMGTYAPGDPDSDQHARLSRIYKSRSVTACRRLPPSQIETLAFFAYKKKDYDYSLALNRLLSRLRPQSVQTLNNVAVLLRHKGRTAEAGKLLQKALHIQDSDRFVLLNRADVLNDLGKASEAITVLRTATTKHPEWSEAWVSLGNLLRQHEQHEDALKVYDQALLRWPADGGLILGKAIALSALGRKEEALGWFDDAVRRNPTDAYTVYNRGVTLMDLGQPERAIRDFRAAVRRDPSHLNALYNIGTALLAYGQPTRAQSFLRRAAAVDPRNTIVLNNLGIALHRVKRYREALRCYAAIREIDPHNGAAYFNQAATFEQLGDLHNAAYFAKEAIRQGGAPATYYFHLGRFLTQVQNQKEALQAFEKALRLDSQCVPALVGAGYVAFEMRRFRRAHAHLSHALTLSPNDSAVQALQVTLLMHAGRHEEAHSICDSLLRTMPGKADLVLLRIDLLIRMNRWAEARHDAERLRRRNGHDGDTFFNLGTFFAKCGRFKTAVTCFRKALLLSPEDSQAHTNLGMVLFYTGRLNDAIQSFVEALVIDPEDGLAANALAQIEHYLSSQAKGAKPDLATKENA